MEYSDAYDKDSLKGDFNYVELSGGPVQSGYAWGPGQPGEDVHMSSFGVTAGTKVGVNGGTSNTKVSGYLLRCGNWFC
jgi:hypothetical protein